jgi:hypothetical protein
MRMSASPHLFCGTEMGEARGIYTTCFPCPPARRSCSAGGASLTRMSKYDGVAGCLRRMFLALAIIFICPTWIDVEAM